MSTDDGTGEPTAYEPTWESLDQHECPAWYDDAKLGIFVHWGVYAVPGWAPPGNYAEWYPYYMYEDGHETNRYHRERYGSETEYDDFIDRWEAAQWDPGEWASFFADVGAGYVVLTGEHHDGFPLWDTHYTAYNATEMGPERDVVGDLAAAVRDEGLRFGASYHANMNYYQPGFEGRFGHPDYHAGPDGSEDDATGPGPEYVDFMNAKHRELIRRYEPDLLWFDHPQADADHLNSRDLVADYYNTATEWEKQVAVNDRSSTDAHRAHADIYTPEYDSFDEITPQKWEACRGIGASFGYNRNEEDGDYLSADELVCEFVDIVSKNGNLLINVGPRSDGTIPEAQRTPLEGLGRWLERNGEAIVGTTYWAIAEDPASEVDVRYTWADDTLYAICLEWPGDVCSLSLGKYVDCETVERVFDVGDGTSLEWELAEQSLRLETPARPTDEHATYAYAFGIDGVSNPRSQ